MSPTGRDSSFRAFGLIGSLVASLATDDEGSWLFTRDELQLDSLPMDDVVHLTRALVDLETAGRFRPDALEPGTEVSYAGVVYPTAPSPIERPSG